MQDMAAQLSAALLPSNSKTGCCRGVSLGRSTPDNEYSSLLGRQAEVGDLHLPQPQRSPGNRNEEQDNCEIPLTSKNSRNSLLMCM